MIQRIQSLFLFLAAAAFGGLFKLPFASTASNAAPLFQDSLFNIYDHNILLVLAALGIIIALIAIFLFRNRALQVRLSYLVIILSIFLPVTAAWIFFTQKEALGESLMINDGIGLYLPIISLISAILATRFIRKDDKLVKSMDRLR